MDQHIRSTLSHTVVQCSPQSSWDLGLTGIGNLGYSTQPWGHLVADTSISGNDLPSLSMMHQPNPPTFGEVSLLFEWIYGSSPNIIDPHAGRHNYEYV